MEKRKRGYAVKRRVYVLAFASVSSIIGIIIWIIVSNSGYIDIDTIEYEKVGQIVIARDEQIVTSDTYGKIIYTVKEGQQVTAGATVAQVYKWGYNDNILSNLITLEQKIYDYQQKTLLKDIVNTELEAFNQKIEELLNKIAEAINSNEKDGLLDYQKELEIQLNDRVQYLKSSVQADAELESLFERQAQYNKALDEWRLEVLAAQTGRISFYFDGYETLINKNTLENLTSSDVVAVRSGKVTQSSPSYTKNDRPLYKIVQDNVFYVVIPTDKNNTNGLVKGESYTVNFKSLNDKKYEGVCTVASKSEIGSAYAIEINDSVMPLLALRVSDATITSSFTGLSVDVDALINKGGGNYSIAVFFNGNKEEIPIEVLHKNSKKAVFRSSDARIAQGMRYAK